MATNRTALDYLHHAGLDWTVQTARPAVYVDGYARPCDGYRAQVRSDTGETLSITGESFTVFQNYELAHLADQLVRRADGRARVVDAGEFNGGGHVWFEIELDRYLIGPSDGLDENRSSLLLHNSHDGRRSLSGDSLHTRFFCMNQILADTTGVMRVRHSRQIRDLAEAAWGDLLASVGAAREFKELAQAAARKQVLQGDALTYFEGVWQRVWGELPSLHQETEAEEVRAARAHTRAVRIKDAWYGNLGHEFQVACGIETTYWGLLNAVTQWVDHERTTAAQDPGANRLFGSGGHIKAAALTELRRVL